MSRHRGQLQHGTDSGYAHHRRNGVPFPEDEGDEPCGCRIAHKAAEQRRLTARLERQEAEREARFTCPECGGPKRTRDSKTCVKCSHRPRRQAPHGTEGGYYWEVRHSEVPCRPCTDAHNEAERLRAAGRPKRVRRPKPQSERRAFCPDCGTRVSHKGARCRPCATERYAAIRADAPTFVRQGLIWRAA